MVWIILLGVVLVVAIIFCVIGYQEGWDREPPIPPDPPPIPPPSSDHPEPIDPHDYDIGTG